MDRADFALKYAARGWPVFPLRPREKTPLTKHGFQEATTNANIIERWWDRWPDANIGVATGPDARVWVLDVDGVRGSASLTALETELGCLPDTLDQQTGGGGRQLFFLWPDGREIRNRANVRPGIDVRGQGGYVVLPPSIHPSGRPYDWVTNDRVAILAAPEAWLDLICRPKAAAVPASERVAGPPSHQPTPPPASAPLLSCTPLIERASRYLKECPPAIQGSGGHNALLWAARCLVTGFELDDASALDLLWREFNPRCDPPWDADNERERCDFERKVHEARRTPCTKPSGWLLSESAAVQQQIANGRESAAHLLANHAMRVTERTPVLLDAPATHVPGGGAAAPVAPVAPPCAGGPQEEPATREREAFPTDALPVPIAAYCQHVAEAHGVDESVVGLALLVVAGAAIGNAWRLSLKDGYLVPPLLWAAIIAPSGSNKTAPLEQLVKPLRRPVPIDRIDDPILAPASQALVGNATVEAVIACLVRSPRGLLCFNDELAGWVRGFGQYKKGGGGADEATWLSLWNGSGYQFDRKTNSEHIYVPAASVAVLGGIQPLIFARSFSSDSFASGLVPRLLVTMPPRRPIRWTEAGVSDAMQAAFDDALTWLRTRPFCALDSNRGEFLPHVLAMTDEAKNAYVHFYNTIDTNFAQDDERVRSFLAKSCTNAARIALILHGLLLAVGSRHLDLQVGITTVSGAIRIARWCLDEQLRAFGLASREAAQQHRDEVLAWIRSKDGRTTVRALHQSHRKRYAVASEARAELDGLVASGAAVWEGKECVLVQSAPPPRGEA